MQALLVFTLLAVAVYTSVSGQRPPYPPAYNNDHNYGGNYHPEDKIQLKFKVSGRSLPDKDTFLTIDPYVKIYYSENDSSSESKLGRTETLRSTKNPDWSDVFTLNFDRSKRQRLHFVVKDHDLLQRDDKAGEAWMTVSDYVDNKQYLQVNLKKGFLIVQRA